MNIDVFTPYLYEREHLSGLKKALFAAESISVQLGDKSTEQIIGEHY